MWNVTHRHAHTQPLSTVYLFLSTRQQNLEKQGWGGKENEEIGKGWKQKKTDWQDIFKLGDTLIFLLDRDIPHT